MPLPISRSAFNNIATRLRAVPGTSAKFSSVRLYSSTMHDNDPEVLELEKKRNLLKIQHKTSTPLDDAPGWNERLATTSEASVKADRSTDSPLDQLRKTIDYIHALHPPDDNTESTEAFYAKDEVTGPLSGALGVNEAERSNANSGITVKKVVREEKKVVTESSTSMGRRDIRV